MIDNYLLEELVAFAKEGTLAKASEKLGLSQPAITRGTQKIENELGIKIFDRTPNKITLNKTGEYAAERAEYVLKVNQDYITEVKNFDNSNKEITIASIAPGPVMLINSLKQENLKVNDNLIKQENLDELLLQNQYTCIISNEPIDNPKIESDYLGMEALTVHLNEFSNLASKSSVTFNELRGLSFLVLSDIGIWKDIIQKEIPEAKFLYQNQLESFNEIKNYSVFPFFTTNISKLNPIADKEVTRDRVPVRISDPTATQSFYANYLKTNKKRLEPVIEEWQDAWEKVD